MSKSKGNVVDPRIWMLEKYGADALRLYVMFVAPPEKEVEWTDTASKDASGSWLVSGARRPLARRRGGGIERVRRIDRRASRCGARRTRRSARHRDIESASSSIPRCRR
jgi:hypothetical protein